MQKNVVENIVIQPLMIEVAVEIVEIVVIEIVVEIITITIITIKDVIEIVVEVLQDDKNIQPPPTYFFIIGFFFRAFESVFVTDVALATRSCEYNTHAWRNASKSFSHNDEPVWPSR